MVSLDYLLYDNRTWAVRIGRDWGIKAATGVLGSRPDLLTMFDRYCGSLPSDLGCLNGFGHALGGIRSADGYLLCVTIETPDPFGRPSWAVYGLWCPDAEVLRTALTGDPLRAVRAALSADTPPPALELRPFSPGLLPSARCTTRKTTFRRFDRTASISEVTSLLLGAVERGNDPPDVLGITGSNKLPALGERFNVIYCHPLDERTERTFEQLRNDEPFAPLPQDGPSPMPGASKSDGTVEWTITALVAAAIVAACAFISTPTPWHRPNDADRARPLASTFDRQVSLNTRPIAVEMVLLDLEAGMAEILALNPDELRSTLKETDSQQLRDACAALIEDRERIVGRPKDNDDVADYYQIARIRTSDPVTRLANIRAIVAERPMGGPVCADAGMTNPMIRRWCDSLKRFERAAHLRSDVSGRTES